MHGVFNTEFAQDRGGLKERRTDHKIPLIGGKDTHTHVHKIKNYIKLRKDAHPSTDL